MTVHVHINCSAPFALASFLARLSPPTVFQGESLGTRLHLPLFHAPIRPTCTYDKYLYPPLLSWKPCSSMIFLTWSVQIRQLQQLPSLRWLRVSLHVPYHGWLFQRGEQLLNMDALVVTAGNYAIPHPSGCVQFYTINDIIPLIMGRKECIPTLFPASVMEAG